MHAVMTLVLLQRAHVIRALVLDGWLRWNCSNNYRTQVLHRILPKMAKSRACWACQALFIFVFHLVQQTEAFCHHNSGTINAVSKTWWAPAKLRLLYNEVNRLWSIPLFRTYHHCERPGEENFRAAFCFQVWNTKCKYNGAWTLYFNAIWERNGLNIKPQNSAKFETQGRNIFSFRKGRSTWKCI